MITIYMTFMTVASALAKGSTECSFTSTEAHTCFVAVGQQLIFYMPSLKENSNMRLTKDNKHMILNFKNNKVTFGKTTTPELQDAFKNGRLTLGKAMKSHSGDYVLEEFEPNGSAVNKLNMHLEIQAPVSKPDISHTCLSLDLRKISCSSAGDKAEFSFALDRQFLIHTGDKSQHNLSKETLSLVGRTSREQRDKVTVNIHGQLVGQWMCRVQNRISKEERVIDLESCKGFLSLGGISLSTLVAVAMIASVITLLLHVALFFAIKFFTKKEIPVLPDTNEHEITYSDVRVMMRTAETTPDLYSC